jgi:CRISPR-associated endonuclease/helicase Cas3
MVALAIAGHHAGIPDLSGSGNSLAERSKVNSQSAQFRADMSTIIARATNDSEHLRQALQGLDRTIGLQKVPFADRDLYTRMLFSCLVDADRLDSGGLSADQRQLPAPEYMEQLLRRVSELRATTAESQVSKLRAQVLRECLDAASEPGSLFSLSVPTGGGKTLAAMAFALRRAMLQRNRFRRVIVVIPYLSIIEQNAQIYADIFGRESLLEHHSGSLVKLVSDRKREDGDDIEFFRPAGDRDDEDGHFQITGRRNATENWDAPLIVTTSVRFFESLFSNRPRDLRRVHNIARSIVILDEVQTLPRRLLGPLLGMIKELSGSWGVNFIFSTATQPAFECRLGGKDLRWEPGTIREIIREPQSLRRGLRRAEISWEIDTPMGWSTITERMLAVDQCLAIVNIRDHAADLYGEVIRQVRERGRDDSGIFHLSTRMCAAHRLRVLGRIRDRLHANLPCQVISTQLVEAGVDVDFPLVLRALAPLDAIVQAAGRADREGLLTARLGKPGGLVVVFLPEDHRLPPNEYTEAARLTEALARQALLDGRSIQVDSEEHLMRYFDRYYGVGEKEQGADLVGLRGQLKLAALADEFEMISDRTREVFVPDDEEARQAIQELRRAGFLDRHLRRRLQRHVVGLTPSEFRRAGDVLEELSPGSEIWIALEQGYNLNYA